ncbi:MAG: sugar phosphate isomerase/epimerase [Gemmatimonadaceae bacterium]
MHRRTFVHAIGAAVVGGTTLRRPGTPPTEVTKGRRLKRVGIQLYTLREGARTDLGRTLADIASAGYSDVEMLGSANNFGTSAVRVREMLDQNRLRAPSSHVGAAALDDLPRQLDDAGTMGHEYLIVAGFPGDRRKSLDDYRYWADRLNTAGVIARRHGVWLGFHNHATDFATFQGVVAYDVFAERTDPTVVRLQLDTGNLAATGRDPLEYVERFGNRYWSYHIKDVPHLGATTDSELGKGIIDFRRLLARVDKIDEKLLFVEQETYPGAPLESARRDYAYISTLEF